MFEPAVPSARPTFLESDRLLARAMHPVARFIHIEAAGGLLLLAATVVALVWANSPWSDGYAEFWSTEVRISIGSHVFDEHLVDVVNDLLMALFFFVVGMEIKRELVVGELRDRRAAALPAMAAAGGMVMPALIYLAINAGGPGARGWGVPIATDIAFALGVVAVLGSRVSPQLRVFLLTLAIVDDIGAIAVIAVFYSHGIAVGWLIAAVLLAIVVASLHRVHVIYAPVFVMVGGAMWLCTFESGVHATIAGVVMGLLMPARPFQSELQADEIVDLLENRPELEVEDVRATARLIRSSVSPCDRLIDVLHPWTSFVIIPLFALANAGIELSADAITDPTRVTVGVVVGLVVGKLIGVVGFGALCVRLGIGRLPSGVGWREMAGIGALAGIGFTVSLFVTGLAFDSPALQDQAKIGTLVASVIAALLGSLVFVTGRRLARSS